jgi:methyl-accepting chemotaxis protein
MRSPLQRVVHLRDWSLVARIVAVSSLIGLAFAGTTTAIGYGKASAGLTDQAEARLHSDTTVVTTAVDNWTSARLQMVRAIAAMPAVVHFVEAGDAATDDDAAFASQVGEALKANMTDVIGVSILDAQGIVRASQTAKIGTNFSNRDYFSNAIKGNDFISGVSVSLADGLPKIFISTPIRSADGRIIGVANANGDPAGLQRVLDGEQQRTGAAGRGLLLDEQGLVIANTVDPDWLLRPVLPLAPDFLKAAESDKRWGARPTPDALGEKGLAPAIAATQPKVFDWQPAQGGSYHAVVRPLSNTRWTYVSALPTTTFEAAATDLLRTSAVAVLAGLVLAIGLAVLATRPLASGMRRITRAARQLAEGDLDGLLESSSRDEVGQIAQAFGSVRDYLRELADVADRIADGDLTYEVTAASERDQLGAAVGRMQTRLRELVAEMQTAATAMADTATGVSQSAAQAGLAAEQVAGSIQHVASGAHATSRDAEDTGTAVANLSEALDSIAQGANEQVAQLHSAVDTARHMAEGVELAAARANRVAQTTERTSTSADRGAEAVRETVAGITAITTVVADAAERVNELGRLGGRIGSVVETIDEIASQTNLLALNAAIEAARAGEHGRGFAVVADEVRKLAERSSRETKQIALLIEEVQKATREAVAAMKVGAGRVAVGAASADLAGEALADIVKSIRATVGEMTEIAASAQEMAAAGRSVVELMQSVGSVAEANTAATEEMAAQTQQVRGAVQNIVATSVEQSAAADQVSASAEEMSSQVAEMSAQAEELSATADHLRQQVARFRLETETETETTDVVAMPRRQLAA